MKSLLALVRLSRPTFLAGGFTGGALGTATAALERGALDLRAFLLAQATITGFHVMTQFANEYFDREGDAAALRTDYSGGSGVLAEGRLAPSVALYAALAGGAIGTIGIAALFVQGYGVAALVAAVMALGAWTYSAPPARLCARGLGELDTAIVVAALVPLVAYAAQAHTIDLRAVAVTLPGVLAMFAMMFAVEIPDRAADLASEKRNLVVRAGRRGAGRLGRLAIAGTFLVGLPLAVAGGAAASIVPFVVLTAPLAAGLWRGFARVSDGSFFASEGVAARGVAFFFLVSVGTLFGEAALLGRP